MKLVRYGSQGKEKPGLIDSAGTLRDLSSVVSDIGPAQLSAASLAKLARLKTDQLPAVRGHPRLGVPLTGSTKFVAIGLNYSDHAAETNNPIPKEPIVFHKTLSSMCGATDDVMLPKGSLKTDWEVELGIVIGRRASYLASPAQSIDHIAGFVTTNDLSERDFQMSVSGGQWSKGKCAPGFNPTGPWLVTPDEVDYQNLALRSWVNGHARQDSTTADQIFPVDFIVWHLSQYLALEPGDLVLTGTPEGVALSGRFPYLAAGDVCEIEIDGLGRQRQEFVSAKTEGQQHA